MSLLSLILMGRMLQLRELFLGQSMSLAEIAELFVYLSPLFLLLIMPISSMLAVFLTFLRLSSDREFVALKAGGVSLYQLLPSVLVFCLLMTATNLFISFEGLSWGMENFRSKVLEMAKNRTQIMLQPGVFNTSFPGLTLFAGQFDPKTSAMELVFVKDSRGGRDSVTILAPRGQVVTDQERGRILFALSDGAIYNESSGRMTILRFGEYYIRLDLGKLLGGVDLGSVRPKEMSLDQLLELSADESVAREKGESFYRNVLVEIQKRFALPAACFVLGLFALPFAVGFQGLKQYLGLVLALGFFMVYYTMFSVSMRLGESGLIDPRIGIWLPNLLFLTMGLVGIRMTAREQTIRVMDWVAHLRIKFRRSRA